MRELAPSGAYVEEWERLPDSTGQVAHLADLDAPTMTNLYVAGRHALLCVKNPEPGAVHEFSWGRHSPATDQILIELSTIAHRVGHVIDVDRRWHVESYCEREP